MSFAGHVYDMIRRDKENRELKNQRRNRNKETRQKYIEQGISYPEPDITLEEFEQINEQIKKREEEEARFVYRRRWIYLGIGFVTVLIMIGLLKLLVIS